MFFQLDRALPGKADQLEQKTQKIAVIIWRPFRALERLAKIANGVLGSAATVGDEERAKRRPADHHHLIGERLDDDPELSAGQQVAAKDHAKNNK